VERRSTSTENPSRTHLLKVKMAPEVPVRLRGGRLLVNLHGMVESPCRAESQRVCPGVLQYRGSNTYFVDMWILQILVAQLQYQGEPLTLTKPDPVMLKIIDPPDAHLYVNIFCLLVEKLVMSLWTLWVRSQRVWSACW